MANPQKLMGMQIVTEEDYRRFVAEKQRVKIENVDVEIGRPWRIKEFGPPRDYKSEEFTVWSFPSRGDWATHSGNYRGNWSPYIPRNLITKYSKPGELVLDQMCGSGTDRKSTRLNSSHDQISYAVFCLKKKKKIDITCPRRNTI